MQITSTSSHAVRSLTGEAGRSAHLRRAPRLRAAPVVGHLQPLGALHSVMHVLDDGAEPQDLGAPALHMAPEVCVVILQGAHPTRQLFQLPLLPLPACQGQSE